jgi:hypothetical protein
LRRELVDAGGDGGECDAAGPAAGLSVILKEHAWSPMEGVKICTDPAGQYSRRRLEDILDGLGLSWDQLGWLTLGLE